MATPSEEIMKAMLEEAEKLLRLPEPRSILSVRPSGDMLSQRFNENLRSEIGFNFITSSPTFQGRLPLGYVSDFRVPDPESKEHRNLLRDFGEIENSLFKSGVQIRPLGEIEASDRRGIKCFILRYRISSLKRTPQYPGEEFHIEVYPLRWGRVVAVCSYNETLEDVMIGLGWSFGKRNFASHDSVCWSLMAQENLLPRTSFPRKFIPDGYHLTEDPLSGQSVSL